MDDNVTYKIKDSVDLFLSNEIFIMAYYMNTRQRKSFKVNEETIYLLECIDGEKTLQEIKEYMLENYMVPHSFVETVIQSMIKNHIVTAVVKNIGILAQNDFERYTRQINYFTEFLESEESGIIAQSQVMSSKIAVFGIGAVGGDIAIQLAMAGVSNMVLYDFDKVEISDTARHMYYRNQYDGLDKVEALAIELKNINKKISIEIVRESMKPETEVENLIKKMDFVINTMDEPYIGYTASKISRICIKHKVAHFIAGGFDAHLASTGELIIPYVTPCVECYSGYFKEKLKMWKPKKHPVTTRDKEIGGLASMSLFSASYASIEIVKYLAKLVPMKEEFKLRGEFLFHDMSLTYLNVERDLNCPICGGALENES